MKIRKLTNKTWIVLDDSDQRVGLLSENDNSYKLSSKDLNLEFQTEFDLLEYFGENIFENLESDLKTISDLDGYPTRVKQPILKSKIDNLILYSKNEKSDLIFCAGYFCIFFGDRWGYGLSPKYTTLEKYEYRGPFKTKDEARFEFNLLNTSHRKTINS